MGGLRRRGGALVLAAAMASGVRAVAAIAGMPAAGAAPIARVAACRGTAIVSFTVTPRTVVEGGTATLTATIANCSGRTFSGALQTFGKLACVVVDPISQKVRLAPGTKEHLTAAYTAPPCAGAADITGRLLNAKGTAVSTKTADFTIVAPAGG